MSLFQNIMNTLHAKNIDTAENNTISKKKIYVDSYFEDAGKFVTERNKASVGMLQRYFKIGYNRASEIIGELEHYRIVDIEEGIKPRKVLMTPNLFENFLNSVIIIDKASVNKIPSDEKHEDTQNQKTFESHINALEQLNIKPDYLREKELSSKLENVLITNSNEQQIIRFLRNLIKYNHPKRLKIILLDSGQVTFAGYNDIGNLLIPVVSDFRKMQGAIRWVDSEMQERTQRCLESNVRNIDAYNQRGGLQLPKIIVILDEMYYFPDMPDDFIVKLLLNSCRFGIYFVFFTKFNLHSLQLGIKKELLLIQDFSYLESFFPQSSYKPVNNSYDDMDGQNFELFCSKVLKGNKFRNVELTQGSGDHGIDILAEKDDISYAIQCKCYSSNIGNTAVQQAHTGKSIYHKDIAVVLTNRYFTDQAKEEANVLGVKLWDRNKLNELIQSANK